MPSGGSGEGNKDDKWGSDDRTVELAVQLEAG